MVTSLKIKALILLNCKDFQFKSNTATGNTKSFLLKRDQLPGRAEEKSFPFKSFDLADDCHLDFFISFARFRRHLFIFQYNFPCNGKFSSFIDIIRSKLNPSTALSHVTFKELCFSFVLYRVIRLLESPHALKLEHDSPTRFPEDLHWCVTFPAAGPLSTAARKGS